MSPDDVSETKRCRCPCGRCHFYSKQAARFDILRAICAYAARRYSQKSQPYWPLSGHTDDGFPYHASGERVAASRTFCNAVETCPRPRRELMVGHAEGLDIWRPAKCCTCVVGVALENAMRQSDQDLMMRAVGRRIGLLMPQTGSTPNRPFCMYENAPKARDEPVSATGKTYRRRRRLPQVECSKCHAIKRERKTRVTA